MVQLDGAAVRLRDFVPDDIEAVTAIVGDERVTDWLSFDRREPGEAGAMLNGILARSLNDPRAEYYLAVTVLPDDTPVGFCRLGLAGVQAGKLGFAIHADHWGQGLATDAAATMVDFGFRTLDLHRISAAIGPTNEGSVAIAKKLGMTYEGRLRDHVHTNGAWRDSLLFSVLASEWGGSFHR